MSVIDLQNRAPSVSRTPDFRQIVERRYDVLNYATKTPAAILANCWQPLGTVDEEFTACYLTGQKVEGQTGNFYEPCKLPPVLVRTYLELDGLNETLSGQPTVVLNQFSYKEVTYEYQQLATGTATYQIPGVTAAPAPFSAFILRDQTTENNGTLRTIKRVYVQGGFLDQIDELKFGGHVLIRRLKYLNEVPPTPEGFTLVETSKFFVSGLPVFLYGFAAPAGSGGSTPGSGGEISRDVQYNISPDQGTTGVTVTKISAVSALDVDTNPITGPVGSELIEVNYTDDAGYRLWTATYAQGQGLIIDNKEVREGGKLIIYSRTSIGLVPSTPTATIGGTVTLIGDDYRNGTDAAAGTGIYDRKWAEGLGEVSREFTNSNGGAVAFNPASPTAGIGPVVCTIRYISALSVTSDPTTGPASFVRMAVNQESANGYKIWTVRYGYGNGAQVNREEYRNQGALVIYSRTSIGSPPTTPGPTIGGTVNLTGISNRKQDGFDLYDYQWAEGLGVIGERIAVREGGLRLESWESYSAGTAALFIPPGIPITVDQEELEGITKWVVTCMQNSLGGDPTTGVALEFQDYTDFTYPGRAKLYGVSFSLWSTGTGYVYDVFKSPPVQLKVLAEVEITYTTTPDVGTLTHPLWNPNEWATMRANWQGLDGYAKAEVQTLYGYMSVGTALLSITAPAYPSSVALLGVNLMQNSSAALRLTGGPTDPGGTTVTLAAKCEPAFIDSSGVQYYRRTIVTAAIPTQPALPV